MLYKLFLFDKNLLTNDNFVLIMPILIFEVQNMKSTKAKILSLRFCFLLKGLMFFIPLFAILYWTYFSFFSSMGIQVSNTPIDMMFATPLSRALALGATALPVSNMILFLYLLHSLFSNFSKGIVFSILNVNIYRNIGFTLFALAMTENLFDSLITSIMTFQRPEGMMTSFGVDTSQIIYIVIGGLIWLTSYVMHDAYHLDAESRYTI